MKVIIDKRQGRGALDLELSIGRMDPSQLRGALRITGIVSPVSSGGGGGIPSDAVLYEDGAQVYYEDANYLQYVA